MTRFHGLRKAGDEDITFITALEAAPANTYVHSSDAATHKAQMADPDFIYLIGEDAGGKPLAYAMLRRESERRTEWRRVITKNPGAGVGKAFMKAVLDALFLDPALEAVWLDVYAENDRARHVYRALGFRDVGEDRTKVPGNLLIVMEYARP